MLQSDLPVLVDFGATWCGPCRRLEPVLAHLSVNYDGRLKVGKVDVDEQPDLSAQFEVSGIPAMMLFSRRRGCRQPNRLRQSFKPVSLGG